MPTVEDVIRNFPRALNPNSSDKQIVDNLFFNFCFQAQHRWQYAASVRGGLRPETVLEGDRFAQYSFHCGTLLDVFMCALFRYYKDVLNRSTGTLGIDQEAATLSFPFVTTSKLRCFDRRVVGNVKTQSAPVSQIHRALFSTHYFIKIGGTFYDPTYCTTYKSVGELIWKKMGGGRKEFYIDSKSKRFARTLMTFGRGGHPRQPFYISADGMFAFIKAEGASYGFSETFVMQKVTELTKQQKSRMGIK